MNEATQEKLREALAKCSPKTEIETAYVLDEFVAGRDLSSLDFAIEGYRCRDGEVAMLEDAVVKGDLARHTAGGMELEIHDLRAENQRLREALEKIEAYGDPEQPLGTKNPGCCPYGCDTPTIAHEALAGDQGK